ncbi:MAG TPA: MFS transporter [Myxococcota bacterium]|nr:MFS transporter [Myxococcota bacterium]
MSSEMPIHSASFKRRRFLNWFPMGLTYAFLYMGRYNLTVAKNALGDLMTKEDFGVIFGAGTLVYAFAFLLNGPLTDKIGGKKAILAASMGSGLMNLIMGLFVWNMIVNPGLVSINLVTAMSVMYAINMYFQSFAAVAIVKVNSAWFHVRERGGFSGIFGTMISSGIFFAFTVNSWILDLTAGLGPAGSKATWWVFLAPSAILFVMFFVELILLRDSPSGAGHDDFDTGDASSGMGDDVKLSFIVKKVLTNPIILTVAFIELCTGVIRNGVMHWFPIYAKEVWALPSSHILRNGSWSGDLWWIIALMFAAAAALFVLSTRFTGKRKASMIISGALIALAPFIQGGWGGILFVAGVIGGNVAGWVSDLFFQSRRAPAAGGLYVMLAICLLAMYFTLGSTTTTVGWTASPDYPLMKGDKVVSVNGQSGLKDWSQISRAVACIPSKCEGEGVRWDTSACMCTASPRETSDGIATSSGTIQLDVIRDGAPVRVTLKDPLVTARAGDARRLDAGPVLTLTPLFMGLILFLVTLGVIGTHGLLSGTATMDFGGRKGAATAVGMIDGFVYLGTALQSVSLGFLTTRSWSYWPLFMLPFAFLGVFLLTRIWKARPGTGGGH